VFESRRLQRIQGVLEQCTATEGGLVRKIQHAAPFFEQQFCLERINLIDLPRQARDIL
jgi:hypothetical protein